MKEPFASSRFKLLWAAVIFTFLFSFFFFVPTCKTHEIVGHYCHIIFIGKLNNHSSSQNNEK